MFIVAICIGVPALFFLAAIRVVRPTSRGLIERSGRHRKLAVPGFTCIIPGVDRMIHGSATAE